MKVSSLVAQARKTSKRVGGVRYKKRLASHDLPGNSFYTNRSVTTHDKLIPYEGILIGFLSGCFFISFWQEKILKITVNFSTPSPVSYSHWWSTMCFLASELMKKDEVLGEESDESITLHLREECSCSEYQ